MTREEGQVRVVETYDRTGHVLVLYATGFGKTKAALDCVSRRPAKRGLIVTHSEVARDVTWQAELDKWAPGMVDKMDELIICCYQSLKNIPSGSEFDWVIMDEAHYLTPNYLQAFRYITVKSIILLTATMPEDPMKQDMLRLLAKGNVLKITLDDAVSSGVLNNYKVTVWHIKMTPLEHSAYLKHCSDCMAAFRTGNQNFIHKRTGERMRFIYNLESKYKAAAYLRDQIRETGKRNLIFCGSIEMANRLSPYRYHSGVGDEDFRRFLAGEIKEVASIKQIQEGANFPGLESALVVQLNSKQHNMVQRLGRLMRLPEGKIARMHILVVDDTMDYNWAEKALRALDKDKIIHRPLQAELYLNWG